MTIVILTDPQQKIIMKKLADYSTFPAGRDIIPLSEAINLLIQTIDPKLELLSSKTNISKEKIIDLIDKSKRDVYEIEAYYSLIADPKALKLMKLEDPVFLRYIEAMKNLPYSNHFLEQHHALHRHNHQFHIPQSEDAFDDMLKYPCFI